MSDQYRVDLSELQDTITKLNGVLKSMGSAQSHAAHQTYLPPGALGSGFEEASDLSNAHAEMKSQIEALVSYLNDVMDEFGTNTKRAHGTYSDAEYDAQGSMSGGES